MVATLSHIAAPISAEEYFATCDLERSELIDGKVIELMPPGIRHGTIAGNIVSLLRVYVRQHQLGIISVEGGFRLRRNPDVVRSPDVSFIENARLVGQDISRFLEGAPTLAVEVNSPGDKPDEIEARIKLYFEAGTRAIWIADIATQTISVRVPDGSSREYSRDETLDGAPIFSDFVMPLSEVFDD